MLIDNALASVAVKDIHAATDWYERLIGKPADFKPMPEVAEWTFARGGGLQLYQLAERAGHGSFTFAVERIADVIARAQDLGIDTRRQASSEKVRTLMINDPDGNRIAFAEALDPDMAR